MQSALDKPRNWMRKKWNIRGIDRANEIGLICLHELVAARPDSTQLALELNWSVDFWKHQAKAETREFCSEVASGNRGLFTASDTNSEDKGASTTRHSRWNCSFQWPALKHDRWSRQNGQYSNSWRNGELHDAKALEQLRIRLLVNVSWKTTPWQIA